MAPRFIIKEEKSVDEESEGAPKGVYQGKGCIEGKGVPRRAEGCTTTSLTMAFQLGRSITYHKILCLAKYIYIFF